MSRFFVETEYFNGDTVTISGDNFTHLSKVLRAKVGDEIVVSNDGIDYTCVLDGFFAGKITAKIVDANKNTSEPRLKIHLFQCLPKSDKMDFIIEKCVELGVHKIYPVTSSRSIVKINEGNAANKLSRWRKISEAAAKQCGRAFVPEVAEMLTFEGAAVLASKMGAAIIPYEKENCRGLGAAAAPETEEIAVFIGPEGGFDDSEISLAVEHGILPVTLGKRILRTETAGLNVISILMFLSEGRI